jgi:hypothetical protein
MNFQKMAAWRLVLSQRLDLGRNRARRRRPESARKETRWPSILCYTYAVLLESLLASKTNFSKGGAEGADRSRDSRVISAVTGGNFRETQWR